VSGIPLTVTAGHPRLSIDAVNEDMDGGAKPRHDDDACRPTGGSDRRPPHFVARHSGIRHRCQ
jgi:hypothetical protein